jgi:hypothetical protein
MPRRPLAVVLVALAAGAAAAVAIAQTPVPWTMTVDATVTPNKAGTPAHPQGVKIDTKVKIDVPQDQDPVPVESVDVWFPKGGLYNGGKFPKCSQNLLARSGPGVCPKGSLMGSGNGLARADTVWSHPRITVINGGANKVFFYTVLDNPARVQAPVPGTITKLHGKWSYKLHAVIPKVLQVVAGIPLALQSMHVTAGRGDWIATTSCPPSKKWAYHVEINYNTGQVLTYDDSVPCR